MLYWGESVGERPHDHVHSDVPIVARKQVAFVLRHGRNAHPGTNLKGWATCRICEKDLGSGNLTAFGFVWPERAEHYVLKHDVWTPECSMLLRHALAAANQSSQSPSPHLRRVTVSTPHGNVSVDVEIASSQQAIDQGLMHRTHLPSNAGMLFVMPAERDWKFYMRNTLLPLDLIFIDEDLAIVGIIEHAVPLSDRSLTVGSSSKYVIEVNAGWVAAHGVGVGMPVRIE